MTQSRNWLAVEGTDFTGGHRKLVVTGEVETTNGNQTPKLTPAVPQGINPKVLILELSVETAGLGADVMGWKRACHIQTIAHNQFTDVSIVGAAEASIKVEEVIS
jgi:hypothetical protein